MRINRWTFRKWAKRALVAFSSHRNYDATRRVVVLCYHSVNPRQWTGSISPDLFDEHLGWLRENCDVVPFSQIGERARGSEPLRPRVAITFDDGYADNREYALPLLARRKLPATFFVTAGLLERDPLVLERFGSFDALGPDGIRPLEWNDLSEMLAAGMEVGAHSYSHANLIRCDPESLKREVALSKTVIEQRLGVPVSSMAYPFGLRRAHFDDRVIEAVRQAGYLSAASVLYRGVRSIDLPYEVPRFFTKRDDLDVLRLKVLGGFDVVALWQRSTPLSLGRLLSPDYFGSGERAKAKG